MTARTCANPGCELPAVARGMCNAHYARARREGIYGRMGVTEDRALHAITVGDEALGFGKGLSTDAQGRALQSDLWADLERGLKASGQLERIAP